MELYSTHENPLPPESLTSARITLVDTYVSHVVDDMMDSDYEDAAYLARMAVSTAKRINDEVLIARCTIAYDKAEQLL